VPRLASHRAAAFFSLLAVVALWGATFALVKSALADAGPLTFNAIRMVIAFAVLAVVYRRQWPTLLQSKNRSTIRTGAIVGTLLALGYSFQTAGLALTAATKSALITGTVVVLVPIFAAIPVLRPTGASAPRWNTWAGATIALTGTALLTLGARVRIASLASTLNPGDLLTFACAVCFALHVLSIAHAAPRVPFAQLALLQIGFAAIWMTLAAALLERNTPIHWMPRLIVALAITAVFATAIAYSVQSWAQNYLPATHTALLLALEPVFAWLIAVLALHEHLDARSLEGALLILAGIALTELWPARSPTREA
jgi:drug/metabolite transporter (DMT)-like permease